MACAGLPSARAAETFDAIVIGVGGVGSAALFHTAARGARVLGLDRFPPGHDRGSSHGHTRIIRQAYFEHPHYVPLLRRTYELWHDLEARCGRRLLFETGLVQIGPPAGEVVAGVRASAAEHGLEVEDWSAADAARRLPGFRIRPGHEAVFERRAGYLLVEDCVRAHVGHALRLGAELRVGETVRSWRPEGAGVVVETDRGQYAAARLIIAAGAWAGSLLASLHIGLRVLRKPLFWLWPEGDVYRADRGCPAFLFDLPEGCFYGFPQIDERGVKVAEHSGGAAVDDPLAVDRSFDPAELARVTTFTGECLPSLSAECLDSSVCLYTMSPDGHFIVDRHPQWPQVAFAAGLSGHGFKFTGLLGEVLCQLAFDGRTDAPIEFLSLARFGPREAI